MQKGIRIDNSSLIPKIKPMSETKLEKSGFLLRSPDWVKSLIIEQLNVDSAAPDGTFKTMPVVLDHLAEIGVNGVWLNPIFDGIHYYNYGPATLRASITGTEDVEEGWKVVKQFVDEAHKRNIRVFFDIVTWGVNPNAPLIKEHPDWFEGYSEEYKGPFYNWHNSELFDWFSQQLINIIKITGADGYRADCSERHCGHELYARLRRVLHSEGIYIALMGEFVDDANENLFDFYEHSIDYWSVLEGTKFVEGDINFVSGYKADMIAAVKKGYGLDTRARQATDNAGKLRFYSSIVSCHDSWRYIAKGSMTVMGYASILSPFIPMWYIGEEWNNPYVLEERQWLYANKIDWDKLTENSEFFEKVKRAVRIRRLYPEIFEYFPENHRDVNFEAVQTDVEDSLPAYARFVEGKIIIVVPNYSDEDKDYNIKIPYEIAGITAEDQVFITDLMNGKLIENCIADKAETVCCNIKSKDIAVLGVGVSKNEINPFYELEVS